MMNERSEDNVTREPLHKNLHTLKMREGRFASVCLVEEFIFGTWKQKYRLKNWIRSKIA